MSSTGDDCRKALPPHGASVRALASTIDKSGNTALLSAEEGSSTVRKTVFNVNTFEDPAFLTREFTSVELQGHNHDVTSLVLLENSEIASASADKTVRVWSIDENKEAAKVEHHNGKVWGLAVARRPGSGNLLVSVGADKMAHVISTLSLEPHGEPIPLPDMPSAVCVIPNGSHSRAAVLLSNEDEVAIIDLDACHVVDGLVYQPKSLDARSLVDAVGLPNGTVVVADLKGRMFILDSLSYSMHEFELESTRKVNCLCAIPGAHVVAGGGLHGKVRLIDFGSGEVTEVQTGHKASVTAIHLLPGNKAWAIGYEDGNLAILPLPPAVTSLLRHGGSTAEEEAYLSQHARARAIATQAAAAGGSGSTTTASPSAAASTAGTPTNASAATASSNGAGAAATPTLTPVETARLISEEVSLALANGRHLPKGIMTERDHKKQLALAEQRVKAELEGKFASEREQLEARVKAERDAMSAELTASAQSSAKATEEMLRRKLKDLEDKNRELQGKANDRAGEEAELRSTLKVVKEDRDKFSHEAGTLKSRNGLLEDEVTKLKADMFKHKEEAKTAATKQAAAEKAAEAAKSQETDARSKLATLKSEVASLKSELASARAETSSLRDEMDAIRETAARGGAVEREREALQEKLAELKRKHEDLKSQSSAEIKNLKDKLSQSGQELSKLKAEREALSKRERESKEALDKVAAELAGSKAEKDALVRDVREALQGMDKTEAANRAEKARYEERLKAHRAREAELLAEIQALQAEIQNKEAALAAAAAGAGSGASAARVALLEEQVTQLKAENKRIVEAATARGEKKFDCAICFEEYEGACLACLPCGHIQGCINCKKMCENRTDCVHCRKERTSLFTVYLP